VLNDSFNRIELGKNLKYVSVDANQLNIGEFLKHKDSLNLHENKSDLLLLNEDEYKEDLWVAFSLVNQSSRQFDVVVDVNNSLINDVTFFEVQHKRLLRIAKTGDIYPAKTRSIFYRSFAYPLSIIPGDTKDIVLRFDLDGRKIHLPLIVERRLNFIERVARKEMGLGIYYGVLLLITVLFYYLYYLIKDKAFLYFAGYMTAHSLLQLAISGVANVYIWPWSDWWSDRSVLFLMSLSIITGLQFVVEFITKEKFYLWVLLIIRFFQFAGGFMLISALSVVDVYSSGVWLMYRLIPPFYFLMFIVATSFFINKYLPARIFILGYSAAIVSVCGILYYAYTKHHENVFTNNIVVLGEMFKCVILSIALLDRLKIFKEEKENAQAELIKQLEVLNQYKEKVNEELEIKVEEKSRELIEKQREVRKALILGEEQERKRVAQELHDGMGSLLSTLRLNAEAIDLSEKKLNEKEQNAYANVIELIDRACTELRAISHDMLPIGLDQFGIGKTLEMLIRKINSTGELKINLDVFDMDKRFSKDTELAIYRIIMELINNIMKHAKATQASIQLVNRDDMLSILVEDNGIGLDKSKALHGIGLVSIQTRVEALNGEMNIDTIKGQGTTFNIEIPL